MHTKSSVETNIEKIAQLFPHCITEAEDKNGNLQKCIDFTLLQQELKNVIVEPNQERYRLDWVGKKKAILEANAPIAKTLRPAREESVNFDTTENLFIEGDNLDALKLLQESYLGKVKIIYIDPPYNTGKDFIYKDNFSENSGDFLQRSEQIDEDGNRLISNTETNGRFHSDWLTMIFSRLKLARNLLSDDGVIFISIDDKEVYNLRKLCNEIFGESNFIAELIRNTNSSKNQSNFVSVSHEYCLIYAKNESFLTAKYQNNKWQVKKNNIDEYLSKVKTLQNKGLTNDEITAELKELTKYPRFIDFTNYWYFDERGLYRKGDLGGVKNGNMLKIVNPLTNKEDPIPPGGFRYTQEKMQDLIMDNRVHFHTDGSLPTIKRYLDENSNQRPKSIMSDDQRPDYTYLQNMFGCTVFDNPKQMDFMKRIIGIFEKETLILDFFAGSSTTADAVMQLNAEDAGNRKFIMVQLPERIDDTEKKKKDNKEAIEFCDKHNMPRNIAEISKERIRRAGAKIKADNAGKDGIDTLDVGFRVLKVDSTNMRDVYYRPDDYSQDMLTQMRSNIKDDRSGEDLLFQVMLDWGVPLTLPIECKTIQGAKVYIVGINSLVASFDTITTQMLDEIAELKPLKFVSCERAIAYDQDKTNIKERLKQLSPETEVKFI
nr:site-specific DNA-methyltransferase [Actinobacillus delphinicola]